MGTPAKVIPYRSSEEIDKEMEEIIEYLKDINVKSEEKNISRSMLVIVTEDSSEDNHKAASIINGDPNRIISGLMSLCENDETFERMIMHVARHISMKSLTKMFEIDEEDN